MCRAHGRRCKDHRRSPLGLADSRATTAGAVLGTTYGVDRKNFRVAMSQELQRLGNRNLANPDFVPHEDEAEPAMKKQLLQEVRNDIMDNKALSARQRDAALHAWSKITKFSERWRRAFASVFASIKDGTFGRRFIALGVAGGLAFGLAACGGGGGESNGYKTPPAPLSVSSSESPSSDASTSPPPQDESLIKYGGADPSTVVVPEEIKAQYGDTAAANIAKDGIAALVEGLGNQNALKAGAKSQADFTAVQAFVTPEVWNNFDPNVETASTPADRAIAGISTIADVEGRIPLGNGQYIKDAQSISTVGQPIIRILSREDFIKDHAGDSLAEMGVTYKVAFHGTNTETGKQEQVTYTVAASFALAPTADGKWLIADANNDAPVPSAVTAW